MENDDLCRGPALDGNDGPLAFDGPINTQVFEAYVERFLVPTLAPGDIVVTVNLSSQKRPKVREHIEAPGASWKYLPAYSPYFNPSEKSFSKLEALLREAAERTVDGLWAAIGRCLHLH